MNKDFTWKFTIVLAVILISIYGYQKYGIQQGLDLKGGTSFLLKMDLSQIDKAGHNQALRQGTEILERRVNKFMVSEPIIQVVGEDRILIQLPGLEEQRRKEAETMLQQAAYLEFLLVHQDNERLQADAF